MSPLLASIFNFSLLVVAIVVFARKPLQEYVVQRSEGLRHNLLRVQEQLTQAERHYREITEKLDHLEGEIDQMRRYAIHERETQENRLRTVAQHHARELIVGAEASVRGLYAVEKRDLYIRLKDQMVRRAEIKLRSQLSASLHSALVGKTLSQLKEHA